MIFNSKTSSYNTMGIPEIAQNRQFDARGTLASLARAKIFFKINQTHICCRAWNYEQNDTVRSVLA